MNYKGTYTNIFAVNKDFPYGGQPGDYVIISDKVHRWSKRRGTWVTDGVLVPKSDESRDPMQTVLTDISDAGLVTDWKGHRWKLPSEDEYKNNADQYEKLNADNEDLKAGLQTNTEAIETMYNDFSERLDAIEGGKLEVSVAISGGAVIEYTTANTYSGTINYSITPNPSDASVNYKVTTGSTTIDEGTNKSGSKNVTFSGVGNHTYTINGAATYKGVTKNATAKSTTFSVCKRSYIGYSSAESYSGVNLGSLASVLSTDGVKSSSRRVSNNLGASAYLWIAIPKNGNAAGVSSIQQLGVLTVDIPFDTYAQDSNYTYYRSRSKHNVGSYNFKIS